MTRFFRGVRAFIHWWDLETVGGLIIMLGVLFIIVTIIMAIASQFGFVPPW